MDIKAAYKQLKADYPLAYTALAVLPVTGQVTAIADYAEAMSNDDQKGMVLAAGSIIPGIKLAKMGSKLAPASLRLGSQMNAVEKAIAPVTKSAPTIGKAFGAEQVGEYVADKMTAQAAPVNQQAQSQADFLQAWNATP
jgi:hypothetical protein